MNSSTTITPHTCSFSESIPSELSITVVPAEKWFIKDLLKQLGKFSQGSPNLNLMLASNESSEETVDLCANLNDQNNRDGLSREPTFSDVK
ncbi:unnamed protein product [Gongylonema pulchrum]|uniref:Ovule protein n=1 Tax=Gongylonema pulchrum TaxID=637853 RepID=A0A183CUV9_9BILA|nr:unnamed protein product [Gongylonema pulchrum]